jgi:hypothetical protein
MVLNSWRIKNNFTYDNTSYVVLCTCMCRATTSYQNRTYFGILLHTVSLYWSFRHRF